MKNPGRRAREKKRKEIVENRYGEIKSSVAGRRGNSNGSKKSADNCPHNGWTRRKNSVKSVKKSS